jgi:hypothetical protein
MRGYNQLSGGSLNRPDLIIQDHSWRRFPQLELVAHLLEAYGESFNLLLLSREVRSLPL